MAGSRFGFRTLFADALARAQSAVDSLWRSPPHPPRLVHGDLTPANVIASPPSGLVPIDFQDTTWPVMPSEFAPGCGARSACIPDGTDAGFRRVRERQVASLARGLSACLARASGPAGTRQSRQIRTLVGRCERYPHASGNDHMQAAAAAGLPERITPMTEDDKSTSGTVPHLVQEFMGQLREITERLEGRSRPSGGFPLGPGALPLPGGLSAAQMNSIAESIAAQRRSIEALKAQLSSYDEQLAALEQILGPLSEWSRTWADLEQRVLKMSRWQEGEK